MILSMGESSAASFAANVLLLIEAVWFLNYVFHVSVRCFHSSFLLCSLAFRTCGDRDTEEKGDRKLHTVGEDCVVFGFLL